MHHFKSTSTEHRILIHLKRKMGSLELFMSILRYIHIHKMMFNMERLEWVKENMIFYYDWNDVQMEYRIRWISIFFSFHQNNIVRVSKWMRYTWVEQILSELYPMNNKLKHFINLFSVPCIQPRIIYFSIKMQNVGMTHFECRKEKSGKVELCFMTKVPNRFRICLFTIWE